MCPDGVPGTSPPRTAFGRPQGIQLAARAENKGQQRLKPGHFLLPPPLKGTRRPSTDTLSARNGDPNTAVNKCCQAPTTNWVSALQRLPTWCVPTGTELAREYRSPPVHARTECAWGRLSRGNADRPTNSTIRRRGPSEDSTSLPQIPAASWGGRSLGTGVSGVVVCRSSRNVLPNSGSRCEVRLPFDTGTETRQGTVKRVTSPQGLSAAGRSQGAGRIAVAIAGVRWEPPRYRSMRSRAKPRWDSSRAVG